MKIKKPDREFDRWHLQPEDFTITGYKEVTEEQKKEAEEWIKKITKNNQK